MLIKKGIYGIIALFFAYFAYNGYQIYRFSFQYTETKSEVAVVLGAATWNGKVSPVFQERLNHSYHLYQRKIVNGVILTGGFGKGQQTADSEVAQNYLLQKGIPQQHLWIEKRSKYTFENLIEAKKLMDALKFSTALLVTDPLHSKRSFALAQQLGMNIQPSPTPSSRYKSFFPKFKSWGYETFYYSLGKLAGKH